MPKNKLSGTERKLLTDCESTLMHYNHAFLAVGRALREIRDNALYREIYPTFEEYLLERWDMSRTYAYRLMDAAGVVDDLSPMGNILPTNERQARPLTLLNAGGRIEAWKMVLERATDGRITAALVLEVVAEYLDMPGAGSNPAARGQQKQEDVFGRVSDIKKKFKKLGAKPEYATFCKKTETKLRKLFEEVELTYEAAMKDYLGQ